MTRDDFWDPADAGLDMPRDTDPDAGTPEWSARRTRWQEASRKKDQNVEKYLATQAQQGVDSDTALNNAGFADQPDQGRRTFRLYGNEGLYATQGAAVDPNLDYDWARGIKTYRPGTENAGQSLPINATEREEYAKAQKYRAAGLQGFGQMQNAEKFKQIRGTHFALDPESGNYWNQKNDGTFEWKDLYGRTVAAPRGWTPPPGVGGGPPPFGPAGSYLPDVPGSGGGQQTQPPSPIESYNNTWSGLVTGQPALPAQGYSTPTPTIASTRASQKDAENLDLSSPYQQLQKKKTYGAAPAGFASTATAGGSNAGLKVGY